MSAMRIALTILQSALDVGRWTLGVGRWALGVGRRSVFRVHNEPTSSLCIDINRGLLILIELEKAGEPMAERVAAATDPLNLMRVMPPQGARSFRGHAFPRMVFLF